VHNLHFVQVLPNVRGHVLDSYSHLFTITMETCASEIVE